MRRLECVYLNACHTLNPGNADGSAKSLGERIVEALPHLAVVGWRSKAEDRAASAFARGFYDALGRGCASGAGSGLRVSVAEAFASGKAAFERAGYVLGDPDEHGRHVHGMLERAPHACMPPCVSS